MSKEKFSFFKSYHETFKDLPSEVVGEVVKAMGALYFDGENIELTGMAKVAFTLIRPVIEKSIRYSENGQKGGAPKGNDNASIQAKNKPKTSQKQAKNNPNSSQKQANDKQKTSKTGFGLVDNGIRNMDIGYMDIGYMDIGYMDNNNISPLPPYDFDKYSNVTNYNHIKETIKEEYIRYIKNHIELDDCINKWMRYKDEKKPRTNNHYGETGMIQLLNKIYRQCLDQGTNTVINVINDSIGNNYQGIVWEWVNRNRSNNVQSRLEQWRNA